MSVVQRESEDWAKEDEQGFSFRTPAFIFPLTCNFLAFIFLILGLTGQSIYTLTYEESDVEITDKYGFAGYCTDSNCLPYEDGVVEFDSCRIGSARVFVALALSVSILTPLTWMYVHALLPQSINNLIRLLPASISQNEGLWGYMDITTAFLLFMSLVTVDPNYSDTLPDDYTVGRGASTTFLILAFLLNLMSGGLQLEHFFMSVEPSEEEPPPQAKPNPPFSDKTVIIPLFLDLVGAALVLVVLLGNSIYHVTTTEAEYVATFGFAVSCLKLGSEDFECNSYDSDTNVFPICNLGWAKLFCVVALIVCAFRIPAGLFVTSNLPASLDDLFNKLPAIFSQNNNLWAWLNFYTAFFLLISLCTVYPQRTGEFNDDTYSRPGVSTALIIVALILSLTGGGFGWHPYDDLLAVEPEPETQAANLVPPNADIKKPQAMKVVEPQPVTEEVLAAPVAVAPLETEPTEALEKAAEETADQA